MPSTQPAPLVLIQLGTMNAWVKTPAEYIDHVDNPACKGQTVRYKLGNCYYLHTCKNCGIRWSVDSSG